jgi:alkylation response protein AidB-like acyl-CoA dehydrogenase
MDLDLTEEQQMVIDMTRGMLEEHCPTDLVRIMEDDPKGYPDELWKQMGELGLSGLLIPESYGGGGLGLLEGALVYEEIGRAMAPVPHFVSCVMSAKVLLAAGNDAQKDAWLPKIASGEAILTPAWLEPERGFGEVGVALQAKAEGDGFVLSGRKRSVPYASSADRLIVLARTEDGVDLFLVDPGANGVSLKQLLSQGREAHYQVDFDGVQVSAEDRIGAAGSGWATWNQAMLDGIVLIAAQAIGGANRCLEETVAYAKERVQFDKPLGAFQSLAHYMADASTSIDGGRVLVHEAAWNADQGRSISRFGPMAKLFCCEAFRETTRVCAQIWGGVAFTIEYDQQMFFRRAKALQLSWWDTPYLEELIAADVLD